MEFLDIIQMSTKEVEALGIPKLPHVVPLEDAGLLLQRADAQVRLAGADVSELPAGAARNQFLHMRERALAQLPTLVSIQEELGRFLVGSVSEGAQAVLATGPR